MALRDVFIRWPRSARQAKGHAIILAVIMWGSALAVGFIGRADRSIAGPLKGADFVQFYTLGHLARAHQIAPMFDMAAYHQVQATLVPASAPDLYPTVYPPQVAVLFAPVSGWPFQRALLAWSVISVAIYALIVWSGWRAVKDRLPDRVMVFGAAAAFAPFWTMVLYGQVTMLILGAFWAAWLALERRQHLLAGMALGLLAIKPQFGLPLVVIVLARREWAMLAGACLSIAAQAMLVWIALGWEALDGFARTLPITLGHVDMMESKPYLSHSLRSLTRLAPNWIGVPLWLGLVAIVLWFTAKVWRSSAAIRIRLGMVMLASVLVNPHLIIYDAAVLALPLLWFGAFMEEPGREQSPAYWRAVYWLMVTLFVPTAAAIGIQLSVLLMMWLFLLVSRTVLQAEPGTSIIFLPRPVRHVVS